MRVSCSLFRCEVTDGRAMALCQPHVHLRAGMMNDGWQKGTIPVSCFLFLMGWWGWRGPLHIRRSIQRG